MLVLKPFACNLTSPPRACWRMVARRAGLLVLGSMLAMSAFANERSGQSAERLGTLFYSAAERVTISRARHNESDPAQRSNLMTVNGVVKRGGANSTAWVNGEAVAEGQSVPPATALTMTQRGVTLNGIQLHVGETIDLVTRERNDLVTPGAVTVKRSE